MLVWKKEGDGGIRDPRFEGEGGREGGSQTPAPPPLPFVMGQKSERVPPTSSAVWTPSHKPGDRDHCKQPLFSGSNRGRGGPGAGVPEEQLCVHIQHLHRRQGSPDLGARWQSLTDQHTASPPPPPTGEEGGVSNAPPWLLCLQPTPSPPPCLLECWKPVPRQTRLIRGKAKLFQLAHSPSCQCMIPPSSFSV